MLVWELARAESVVCPAVAFYLC